MAQPSSPDEISTRSTILPLTWAYGEGVRRWLALPLSLLLLLLFLLAERVTLSVAMLPASLQVIWSGTRSCLLHGRVPSFFVYLISKNDATKKKRRDEETNNVKRTL